MSESHDVSSAMLTGTALEKLGIRARFTIPSGIVTTHPAVIARIAADIPEIGLLTTKTISLQPREGYREPILTEYYPGCFANAVGLANPGARAFRAAMEPCLPLHGNKPLVVSIMGADADEFLAVASVLEPIAHAFELNLSCPHVKGAGQSLGADPEAVRSVLRTLKECIPVPLIPKLSPNLGNVADMARLCRDEGADALTLINTVGPGMPVDQEGGPVLSNVLGGLSGGGILPLGLRAVRDAAGATELPIIATGGISSAQDVIAYRNAGAALFGVGSALAGMSTPEIAGYFASLSRDLADAGVHGRQARVPRTRTLTRYFKTRLTAETEAGDGIFLLEAEAGLPARPGQFFFLRLPGIGEKPFSPARAEPPHYLIRAVGPFTEALKRLEPGAALFMRGPYGNGFPEPDADSSIVLVGGGTGVAPLVMAGRRWADRVVAAFFGFSRPLRPEFEQWLLQSVPRAAVCIDGPGEAGAVVRALSAEIDSRPAAFAGSLVFLCGPAPMMHASAEACAYRIPSARVFMAREDIMRCGVGICGSCGTTDGSRSCVDGPVMPPMA